MEHHHKKMTSSSPNTNNHMVQGSHAPCGTGDLHTLRDHSEITHPVEQGSHTPCGTGDLHSDINHPVVQGSHAPCCTGGQHYKHASPCGTGITCTPAEQGATTGTNITQPQISLKRKKKYLVQRKTQKHLKTWVWQQQPHKHTHT